MPARYKTVVPYLAPALLLGVAVLQLVFAQFFSLSPWKGGGFGMFATVDSPGARFVRLYLITAQEEIPVMVPDDLRTMGRELRTTGSKALTEKLARSLAEGSWVELRLASAVHYYQYLLEKSGQAGPSHELNAELGHLTRYDDAIVDLGKLNFVRMLRLDESASVNDRKIFFQRVRVELWKYEFDQGATVLEAKKLLEVTSSYSGRAG